MTLRVRMERAWVGARLAQVDQSRFRKIDGADSSLGGFVAEVAAG